MLPEVRLAARVYRWAAIYGVIVLAPLYLLPVPNGDWHLTHLGFVGTALVFQGVFWVMSGDPLRYRALVPVTIFEKLCFGIPAVAFWARGQANPIAATFGTIDLLLAALFLFVWIRLRRLPA